jgi:branched-chain amino acid transport system substrate-binding protein
MKLVPRIVKPLVWVALALAATMIVAACGSTPSSNGPVTFKGTKKVGYSAPLTGQSALYGHAVSQSLNLAADDINAKGGVNGYKIEMDIQDDGTTVPQAVSNTKNMILQDNVVALMGSVTSAQCLAESPIAKQNKVITIDATCNSWQLTTESDIVNPYWVSIVPNTYMEGTAAGRLAASLNVSKIFIVSPKYLFGISETNAFVAALKKANSSVQIVNDPSTWYVPFPTNPRWDSTINAIQSAKPDLVYSNIFAADQINFVKQALAVDPQFFVKYPMTTLVSVDELNTLGAQYPLGMHAYMRAPFFALQNNNPRLTDFISRYRAKYNGEYPSDWAVMDYDAFTLWAQAANAAKSFDADKVVKQISGHTFDSLRGYKITIRPDELQANVGETIGTTTSSSAYPFPVLKDSVNLKGDDLMMPLQMVNEIKGDQCDKTAGQPNTANFALCPSWKAS